MNRKKRLWLFLTLPVFANSQFDTNKKKLALNTIFEKKQETCLEVAVHFHLKVIGVDHGTGSGTPPLYLTKR